MTDAFVLIQEQHNHLLHLLDELTFGPERRAQTSSERKKLAERLVMDASRHEAAEEQFLWPEVKRLVDGGAEMAQHAIEQESTAKRLLHDLDRMSAGNEDFDTLVRQVSAELHDHVSYEEATVLPSLRLRMSQPEAERLGEQYRRAYEAGPTRPHPLTPPEPGVLKVAGMAVAAVDRTRDLITRRGR